jgi:beta-phosphoglucomutase
MERHFLQDVDQRLQLFEMFNGHVYSIEDIGFIPKPKPDIFLYTATQLGVNPVNCAVIEDAPNGIQAANTANMRSIGITASVSRELLVMAGIIVDSFAEIKL